MYKKVEKPALLRLSQNSVYILLTVDILNCKIRNNCVPICIMLDVVLLAIAYLRTRTGFARQEQVPNCLIVNFKHGCLHAVLPSLVC